MVEKKGEMVVASPEGAFNPGAALAALARYQNEQFNVLVPVQIPMDGTYVCPPGFRLTAAVVTINPADTYSPGGNKRALSGHQLDQIAASAGLEITVERVDPRIHPHYSEHKATVRGRDWRDGQIRTFSDLKTVDLRDDCGDGTPGPDRAAMTDMKQVVQARKFIHEICASKARNRAIRHFLGVKTIGYTPQELSRPFVTPCLSLDPSHPTVAAAMLAQATGGAEAFWGSRTRQDAPEEAPALPAPVVVADVPALTQGAPAAPQGDPWEESEEAAPAPVAPEAWTAPDGTVVYPDGHFMRPARGATPTERFGLLAGAGATAFGSAAKFKAACRALNPDVQKAGDLTHEQVDQIAVAIAAARGGAK